MINRLVRSFFNNKAMEVAKGEEFSQSTDIQGWHILSLTWMNQTK